MITFTKVRYQNFLATGNAPITVELTKHPTVLIVGKNGAGKSTMSEAICFALFGKPLRNVNKPKLVNSVNGKDCLVEIWFDTSAGSYYIKRGIKPNIFEIYRNDVLEPIPADLDDYQTTLESILKLDIKAFKQVVVLGSSSYTPFMRLPGPARRDLIEDLLDIEVFSSMNALAKEDTQEAKQAIEKCATARKMLGDQITMAETFAAELEAVNQQAIAKAKADLQGAMVTQWQLGDERKELLENLEPYADVATQFNKTTKVILDLETTRSQLQARTNEVGRDRAFYEQHSECPECEQIITEDFKLGRFVKFDSKAAELEAAFTKCQAMIEAHAKKADALKVKLSEVDAINARIRQLDVLLPVSAARVLDLEAEIAKLQAPAKPPIDVDALYAKNSALSTQHAELSKRKVLLDAATLLLKDNGIKTRVVRHYLPIINRTVNHYLTAMDFPVLFEFDEAFEESFKSRHRDEFTYELFSDGEKQRINLALLLTWREIAKLKNSASTNLLLFDEVFDGSLDAAGVEEVLKIIHALEKDTNVIVISHHTDQYIDKFDHTMVFDKHKGFSTLK